MRLNKKKRNSIIISACILQVILFFSFLLYSPSMQSFFARQFIKIIAKHYEIEASIDKLYYLFPNKIVLETIEVKDSLKKDILIAEEITASISNIKIFSKEINLKEIKISHPEINTYIDSTGTKNFDYILNKFKSDDKDTTKTNFQITCKNFTLDKASFAFVNHQKDNTTSDSLLNFNNFKILDFSTKISNIKYDTNYLSLNLEDFNCRENYSGYNIKQIKSELKLSKNEISLKNLNINLNNSKLFCSDFQIKKRERENFDWKKDLSVNLIIDSLALDISELAFFLPEYKNVNQKMFFSGKFSGKYSNFKCNNLKFNCGLQTNLIADISINGLPDYDNTYIFGNIENFNTNIIEIQNFINAILPKNKINLKEKVNFSRISFTGNITGLMNDFVTYGVFSTNLGVVKTDAALISDFENNNYKFNGNISTENLELGKILNDTVTFGKISLDATINGDFSQKYKKQNNVQKVTDKYNYFLNTDCNIKNACLLGYDYQNITINGELNNSLFEGKINIDDPNLKFLFDGKYFISSTNINDNELNFRSYVKANLSNLKFLPDSVNSNIVFYLNSNIKGNVLVFPEGSIDINNLKFTYNERLLQIPKLSTKLFLEHEKQFIKLNSDLLEFDANGKFNFNELTYYVNAMLNNYLSAFFSEPQKPKNLSDNDLEFTLIANKANDIIQMFSPQISIPDELVMSANFSSKENTLTADLSVPLLKYDTVFFWGNELNINCSKDKANIFFTNQEIGNPNALVENITIKSLTKNNRNLLKVAWNNNDTLNKNSGEFTLLTKVTKEEEKKIPIIENILYRADFIVNNNLWNSKEAGIYIDANQKYIDISNFSLKHNDEIISAEGKLSANIGDKLDFKIQNFDLSILNRVLEKYNLRTNGYLNIKNGAIYDAFTSFKINLSPEISEFKLYEYNEEKSTTEDTLELEKVTFNIAWNSFTKEFFFNSENSKNFLKKININYNPRKNILNGKINIKDFDVSILNPFLEPIGICELDNNISVDINIGGNLDSPIIDGKIIFTETKLTYDLLNLQVVLNDSVKITNDAFLFENFVFEDREKNRGRINGGVHHNNFKNFRFDFNIFCNNMKILNTSEENNEDYYGTVYGTGSVKIAGDSKRFGIDVSARTEANTVFVLPMSSSYKNKSNDFITFIQRDTNNVNIVYDSPKTNSDFYLTINIDVTPNALIQIDFDPKIGDIIRAKGNGNVKIEYNTNDGFFIYGETEIKEGNYLFTLENIINKKFVIKPGGTITWTGDPVDANIDIYASYKTRAQLKDLFFDSADSTEFNQSANVDCNMHLSGVLTKPNIEFSIEIPNGNEKVKAQLASLSQDDINKQFVFLLIMNRFYNQSQNDNPDIGNIAGTTMTTTSFELISNQISNWLSQISKDLDIGIKYQPGTAVTGQELELALSYQTKNGRFLINGDLGYNDNRISNTNTMVGDIEIQYKVTKNDNFRIKGFSRKNNEIETIYGPYTAGVGLFYTKDFNNLKEMIANMKRSIAYKKYLKQKEKENKEK